MHLKQNIFLKTILLWFFPSVAPPSLGSSDHSDFGPSHHWFRNRTCTMALFYLLGLLGHFYIIWNFFHLKKPTLLLHYCSFYPPLLLEWYFFASCGVKIGDYKKIPYNLTRQLGFTLWLFIAFASRWFVCWIVAIPKNCYSLRMIPCRVLPGGGHAKPSSSIPPLTAK